MGSWGQIATAPIPATRKGAAALRVGPLLAVLALCGCAQQGLPIGVCGDGVTDPLEQCDDGNVADGDGCSALCELEAEPEVLPTLASIQQYIFSRTCAVGGCHDGTEGNPMPLLTEDESYANLVNKISGYCSPPAFFRVRPFLPGSSCLLIKVEANGGYIEDPMPPPSSGYPLLSQAKIDAIRQWIEDGAPRE